MFLFAWLPRIAMGPGSLLLLCRASAGRMHPRGLGDDPAAESAAPEQHEDDLAVAVTHPGEAGCWPQARGRPWSRQARLKVFSWGHGPRCVTSRTVVPRRFAGKEQGAEGHAFRSVTDGWA
jgi:hypothetical protein